MAKKNNQTANFTKTFFELFKTYWGYFMTLVAVVTFIWTIGVKSERNSSEKDSIKNDIVEIKTLQRDQNTKIDSILYIVNTVSKSQQEVIDGQNALRNSYVNFVANIDEITKRGLTTKQFIEYMEGLQFSIKPLEIEETPTDEKTPPDLSIKVKKLEK